MMATDPAAIVNGTPSIQIARARLIGEVQMMADMSASRDDAFSRRLCKVVADYEDVLFADRASFWAGERA